jgi:hypothetical protein
MMCSRGALCPLLLLLCTVRFSLSAPIVLLDYEDDRLIHLIRALKQQFGRTRFVQSEAAALHEIGDGSAGHQLDDVLVQKRPFLVGMGPYWKPRASHQLDDVRLQKRPFLVGMGPYWKPPKQMAFNEDSV